VPAPVLAVRAGGGGRLGDAAGRVRERTAASVPAVRRLPGVADALGVCLPVTGTGRSARPTA